MGLQKVIELLRSGRLQEEYKGVIAVRENGPFRLLNYTKYCQCQGPWDEVTTRCRGLIIDSRDWTVTALPFSKFFNLNEKGRPETRLANLPREPFTVAEKVDGSLGIGWRDVDGTLRLATRGSFESPQAIRGTQFLREIQCVDFLPHNFTPLFEIIYDGNEGPVIKYPFQGLVLLAIMDRFAEAELPMSEVRRWADAFGIPAAKEYEFNSAQEIIDRAMEIPDNDEGYVIRFASGLRVKVKGKAYLEKYRLVSNFTEEKVIMAIVDGRYNALYEQMPEEFAEQMDAIKAKFDVALEDFRSNCEAAWAQAPKGAPGDKQAKKTFALWVRECAESRFHGTLFQLYEGKPVDYGQIIAKKMFK